MIKQSLYDLLEQGKLKDVFAAIKKIADTQSSYFSDPLILLQSRFNRNENDNNNGLIDRNEYNMQTNRIISAVKSLIDSELDERRVPATFRIEGTHQSLASNMSNSQILNSNVNAPIKIFISFSKSDNDQRKELRQRLRYFEKTAKTIVIWDDRDLYSGSKWNDEITKQLQTADIIICLISKYYLGTDYILENEIPLSIDLVNQGTSLIPIILSKCNWQRTALGEFNAIPEKGKPIEDYKDADEAWEEIVDKILDVVDRLRGKNN
jgi:TIR domain/Effector-associated domain 11